MNRPSISRDARRAFLVLASMNLSDRDLLGLRRALIDLNENEFVHLMRVLETETNSISEWAAENYLREINPNKGYYPLIDEANWLRMNILHMSVGEFMEYISFIVSEIFPKSSLPEITPKRGLRSWMISMIDSLGPNEVYHALSIARERHTNSGETQSWRLRS